jgi:hypothetical protein
VPPVTGVAQPGIREVGFCQAPPRCLNHLTQAPRELRFYGRTESIFQPAQSPMIVFIPRASPITSRPPQSSAASFKSLGWRR